MQTKLKLTFFLAVVLSAGVCRADELADKGREIFKKNQRTVVTVQVVQKMTISVPGSGGAPREMKQDLTGTVVDGSGLTVLALTAGGALVAPARAATPATPGRIDSLRGATRAIVV